MSGEIIMSAWQFYSLLLSAFVLGFSTGTISLWAKLLWRINRANTGKLSKHMVL